MTRTNLLTVRTRRSRILRLVAPVLLLVLAATTLAGTGAGAPAAEAQVSGLAPTPYLGWTSYDLQVTKYPGPDGNPAYGRTLNSEANVLQQAEVMARLLRPHGYQYMNLDSGWNSFDGGPCCSRVDGYGRPIPNPSQFPHGMRWLGDRLHAMGLKFGLYLQMPINPSVYNDGNTPIYGAPGCYTRDIVYPDLRKTSGWDTAYQMDFSNPCAQAYIDSIANELASWGVDYLKLDGVGPGSALPAAKYGVTDDPRHDNTPDVAAWSNALANTDRKIQFTISWALSHRAVDTWKKYTTGWRVDGDMSCQCDTLTTWNRPRLRWNDVVQWIPDAGPGHWNILDSLDVGNGAMDGLTDAERQSDATLWAIEAAPIFTGDDLTKLDKYGLSLLTNDEVLAVDQAGNPAKPLSQAHDQQVWYAANADGSYTVAMFNLGSAPAQASARWADFGISGKAGVRDLWQHAYLGNVSGGFSATLPAHGSRLLRVTPAQPHNGPSTPMRVHATADTPSSVTLSWDAAADGHAPVTGYDVYVDQKLVASVSGTSATVSGLGAASSHRFTVTAHDAKGRTSAFSKPFELTTPPDAGQVSYEAEAPGNTLGGSAVVAACAVCSGGASVNNIGGATDAGTLTIPKVTVPHAGTYLMTISYLNGDPSRVTQFTVNGSSSFAVNLPGTSDKDFSGRVLTAAVPVSLRAGANTIQLSNPGTPQAGASSAFIDRIQI